MEKNSIQNFDVNKAVILIQVNTIFFSKLNFEILLLLLPNLGIRLNEQATSFQHENFHLSFAVFNTPTI